MRRNFFHDQTILIHDLGARGIQVYGQVPNRKRFVRAEGLLIGKRAVFAYQQIYKARGLREETTAIRAEDPVGDCAIARERSRVEESRQVSAVIDMEMGQQNGIYFVHV